MKIFEARDNKEWFFWKLFKWAKGFIDKLDEKENKWKIEKELIAKWIHHKKIRWIELYWDKINIWNEVIESVIEYKWNKYMRMKFELEWISAFWFIPVEWEMDIWIIQKYCKFDEIKNLYKTNWQYFYIARQWKK